MTVPSVQLLWAGIVRTADAAERVVPGGSLLVIDDRIAAVGDEDPAPAALSLEPKDDVRMIDATGMMVQARQGDPHRA